MQVVVHESEQETSSGNGGDFVEPNFQPRTLIVNVSQISVNVLGSITIKIQHSYDGTTWVDVPNLTTGALNSTGITSVVLESYVDIANHIRAVWTFNNANSITFVVVLIGSK